MLVDDVAHGPHPGRQEPRLDELGRRTDRHAADPASHEARAQVRVAHLDRQPFADCRAGLGYVGRREADRRTTDDRDLTGQPDDRQRVATVRLDVDVEDDVAIELGQRKAERRVGRQDEDPVGVAGQLELVARAEHPVARDAHLVGPLDPPATGQDRPGEGDRHALAGGDVRRPAHDLERLAGTDVDPGERQPVGPRMLVHGE